MLFMNFRKLVLHIEILNLKILWLMRNLKIYYLLILGQLNTIILIKLSKMTIQLLDQVYICHLNYSKSTFMNMELNKNSIKLLIGSRSLTALNRMSIRLLYLLFIYIIPISLINKNQLQHKLRNQLQKLHKLTDNNL